ncbi:hypothetical protein OH76DRAFT_1489271 [Lentinus brumalis]|uniref:Uncharacterized protein n=1 Tax=Lentinus brumalis TaxID=2498619 RepID=A0A371CN33_9APHY|nr:hypothetical protein OH76DRAFT_1489271 [Polyporus brumalis]
MADYMCRYRGSLIGKHFKTISQVMVFAVSGLVDEVLERAWLAVGRLTVLIWEAQIDNIKVFVEELRSAINEVLDFAATLSPGLVTDKNKLHILLHLPEHVERFGPALLFSTERYESFNHIFRLCSIHSNRQAPSRDIASAFAQQERCRHVLTGGYWLDKTAHRWVCASPAVLGHLRSHPREAHLLGVPVPTTPAAGTMRLPPLQPSAGSGTGPLSSGDRQRNLALPWGRLECSKLFPTLAAPPGQWKRGGTVVVQNGDVVSPGAEVLIRRNTRTEPLLALESARANSTEAPSLLLASVCELLVSDAPREYASWVVIRLSTLGHVPHIKLKMPTLVRDGSYHLVHAEDILCAVNVQHDCFHAKCTATGTRGLTQEREITSRTRTIVQHKDESHYILNTLGLHNQRYIRMAVPASLMTSQSYFTDRAAVHKHAAESLRDTKLQKKLAREALIRKNAEAALRTTNPAAAADILGLEGEAETGSPDEEDAVDVDNPDILLNDTSTDREEDTETTAQAPALPDADLMPDEDKQGLTAEQVSDVVRFCELSPVDMLIDLKIHLFKNENELLRRFLRIFVRHPDFATRMKAYVAAALLAPIAPAYLDQVYTSLALHLEKNVEGIVGLSPSCRRDPADWMLVKSVLANDLSAERSSMKRKIELAIQNKLDIYAFTQSMMSHDVRPKQAHWARFAWLRKRTIQYKEQKPCPKNYWKFVDEELKAIRVSARIDNPNNEMGRRLAETTFFTQILSADIVAYPITSGAVAKRTFTNEGLTELQVSVENAVRGIVLDDSVVRPDDAPAEDEEQEEA